MRRFTGEPDDSERLRGWNDWYRFARSELGFAHDAGAEYANRRFVEEQNRDTLRGGRAVGDPPPGPYA